MEEGVIIREPREPREFEAIEEIQRDAWGMNDIDIVPYRIIIAIHEAGGFVNIAFKGSEAIGFALGFLGERNGKKYLHSHQLGVKRKYWGRGIGFKLKLAQRKWAISKGISLIKWTFDPLLARNAHLNFSKLGVINNEYHVNLYGVMRDKLNYGMESDRFYVEWWINSKHVKNRLNGVKPELNFDDVSELIVNSIKIKNGLPFINAFNIESKEKLVLVEIPQDIEKIKRENFQLAVDWRVKTRKIFESYFSRGYIAVDLLEFNTGDSKRVFYALIKEEKQKILENNWWELL